MNGTKRRFLYIICIVISLLTPLIVSAFGVCADGGSRVVTTVEELTDAIAHASDGTNVRALASKYGYSEKTVRRILKDKKEEK